VNEQSGPVPQALSPTIPGHGRKWVIAGAAILFILNIFILKTALYRKASPGNSSEYEREWSVAEKVVEVPVRDTEGPERFSIAFRPSPGKRYRFVYITTLSKSGDPSQRNEMRWMITGVVAIERLADGRLGIEYKEEASRTAVSGALWKADQMNAGFAVVEKGKILPALRRGDLVETVPETGRVRAFRGIGDLVALEFPQDMELKVGTEWSTRSLFGTRMFNKVLGFSEVDGRRTVRVRSESDPHEDLDTARRMYKDTPVEIRAQVRNLWQRDRSIIYVDIDTGLVLRRQTGTEYGVLPKAGVTERVPSNESLTIVQLAEI
jgi:hypothetical protein